MKKTVNPLTAFARAEKAILPLLGHESPVVRNDTARNLVLLEEAVTKAFFAGHPDERISPATLFVPLPPKSGVEESIKAAVADGRISDQSVIDWVGQKNRLGSPALKA